MSARGPWYQTERFSPQARYWVYNFLAMRDGEKCAICGVLGKEKELVIDHIDNSPHHNTPDNLRLLCRSCNMKAYIGLARDRSQTTTRLSVNERVGVGLANAGEQAVAVSDEQRSAEFRVNRLMEPAYRREVMFRVFTGKEPLSPSEAIYGIAEKLGMSPVTTKRYLQKMCSPEGPLKLVEMKAGEQYLQIRSEHWEVLTPKPKSGSDKKVGGEPAEQ